MLHLFYSSVNCIYYIGDIVVSKLYISKFQNDSGSSMYGLFYDDVNGKKCPHIETWRAKKDSEDANARYNEMLYYGLGND